jgi:hypothetical protein
VLFDERSERIERNLGSALAVPAKASEDVRCLACHTTPRPASDIKSTAWLNSDGVGCESCHGAAGRYLGEHTTGNWKGINRREKEADWGLWNTKDLARRASICAGCHVGGHSTDGEIVRDVNHDLIAAGHPRLTFELSAFLDNMPAHWDEKDENAGQAGPGDRAATFPARAWAIGRLTTIKAALALLENRVPGPDAPLEPLGGHGSTAASRTAAWPEFSEYGCFSCHHDLRDRAWRRGPRGALAAAGTLKWGTWIAAGSDDLLASLVESAQGRAASAAIDRVGVAMQKPAATAEIKAAAHDASDPIEKSLAAVAGRGFDVATIEGLIDRIDNPQAWERCGSWDEAAGRYLALVPLYQSWVALEPDSTPRQKALRKRLAELLEGLKFPSGLDSPREFEAGRIPSQER